MTGSDPELDGGEPPARAPLSGPASSEAPRVGRRVGAFWLPIGLCIGLNPLSASVLLGEVPRGFPTWPMPALDLVLLLVALVLAHAQVRIAASKVLLALGAPLVTLLVCEGGGQLWLRHLADDETLVELALPEDIPPHLWWYRDLDPYLPYLPNPAYRAGGLRHNSRGFRGRELRIPKPKGVFRIAAVGGSTTYTVKVNDNAQTYPALLEALLRHEQGYTRVEVLNAGVAGYTSWESLINVAFRVLDVEPDLVIVYMGVNDMYTRFVQPEAFRGDNSGYRRRWRLPEVDLPERLLLVRVLRKALGLRPPLDIMQVATAPAHDRIEAEGTNLPPQGKMALYGGLLDANSTRYYRRNLRSLAALARVNGAAVMLATFAHSPRMDDYRELPYFTRAFREHNQVMAEVAAELSLPLFDFAATMPTDPAYWADDRHVNERGSLVKARLFARFIVENRLIPDRFRTGRPNLAPSLR